MNFDSFVLTASTADLGEASAARDHADAIEFRMDLAEEPLAALEAYDGDLPILATNRAEWEGGEASDEGRLEELTEATRFEAVEAVDVELAAIRDGDAEAVLKTARERDVSIVASAHDFEGTPTESEMLETLADACEHADVGKLAVTAHSREETLALLSVTHRLTADGKTVATMAMGEAGSHTRAVAPVYGSKIGYAPVDPEKATAPGQYDLETLSRLVDSLE
ncbi:type I 3-dehydroquinate dehydratase [Natronobacterium texcoconense]|uniref:3-dehydroquinate dehydratase n=1 Tax=Natronobacterium texcoconense TaxID=1095778 RepID=A0A1H0ZP02_NATTX|nr:type I 3-dehydroquinate dehydratase [Natronobacterium texcoconense]SDQ29132.1 3-dehydroquinate dehydratase [Natronobacterium texcoconense]